MWWKFVANIVLRYGNKVQQNYCKKVLTVVIIYSPI